MMDEGAPAATAPLLDGSNVGKWVWSVFNGNDRQATKAMIVKIGRTNIHLAGYGHRTESLRVNDDGRTASGIHNGFGLSAHTDQWRTERRERGALLAPFHSYPRVDWSALSLEQIRQIVNQLREWGAL